MKKILLLLLLLALLICTGCAKNIPAVMLIPKNVDYVEEPVISGSLDDVVVIIGSDVDPYINENNFRMALLQSLNKAGIFAYDKNNPLTMTVYLYQADMPAGGFTMDGSLGAKYTLTNKEGKILFHEDIFFKTSASLSDAFLGSARALLVLQNTNQGHMDLLLQKLKEAFKKPPAKTLQTE